MCFSPSASFTMAGVLTVLGGASIASSPDDSGLLFAAIPLGFAAQQAAEGMVWITIAAPAHHSLLRVAVFAFLAFALVVWPTWVPLSLCLAERDARRRWWLTWLAAAGVVVSIAAAVLLAWYEPHARIEEHSVAYTFGPDTSTLVHLSLVAAYAIPTLAPFFIATVDLASVFGITLIASMAAAVAIRAEALTSVWCFFAAGLSVLVVVSVRRRSVSRRALYGRR